MLQKKLKQITDLNTTSIQPLEKTTEANFHNLRIGKNLNGRTQKGANVVKQVELPIKREPTVGCRFES